MKKILLLFVLFICCSTTLVEFNAQAQDALNFSPERLDRIIPAMDDYIAQGHVTGCVTMLIANDKTVHYEARGLMDRENNVPMRKDAIVRIASMSKPVTVTAAMILYEEGKFLLDDPLSRYIPEFANPTRIAEKKNSSGEISYEIVPADTEITIRHLMNHTSGLTYGGGPLKEYYEKAGISSGLAATNGVIGDTVQKLAKLPLMHNPGEQWSYGLSNDVLGYLIEMWSGRTLEEFMRDRIFKPLKMPDTSFYPDEKSFDRLATIYHGRNGELIRQTDSERDAVLKGPRAYYSGGAGLFSTALDYSRFARMLLNKGELDGERILSPNSVKLMTSDSTGGIEILEGSGHIKATHGDRYGLGLGIQAHPGDIHSIGAYGWGGAFNTFMWIDPEEDIVGIFMSQVLGQPDKTQHRIFRILSYSAIEN